MNSFIKKTVDQIDLTIKKLADGIKNAKQPAFYPLPAEGSGVYPPLRRLEDLKGAKEKVCRFLRDLASRQDRREMSMDAKEEEANGGDGERERDGERDGGEEEEEWALVGEPEDPVVEIFRTRWENRVMNKAIDGLDDVFSPSATGSKK